MIIRGEKAYNKKNQYLYIIDFADKKRFFALLCTLALSCISLCFLYSANSGSVSGWVYRQFIYILISLFFFMIISSLRVDVIKNNAYKILIIAIFLLITVKFAGKTSMGAKRWINFGLFSLQPSEILKIGIVLSAARLFDKAQSMIVDKSEFVFVFAISILGTILVALQPDLTTSGICFGLICFCFFLHISSLKKILYSATMAIPALPLVWAFFLKDYQKSRVMIFLNPELDPLGKGYNAIQSKIAIGSGGLFGKGLLQGTQVQLSFLPEKHTDFIFTTISEEGGFKISFLVILLYAYLIFYAFMVSTKSKGMFEKVASIGCGMFLFFHIAINISMVTGMFPIAGVPLPFLSYGGTTTLISYAAMAIIMAIDFRSE